jgi:hypothetical protein
MGKGCSTLFSISYLTEGYIALLTIYWGENSGGQHLVIYDA